MTDANEIAQAMTPPSCGQDDGLSRAKREAIESLAFGQYVVAHLIVDRAAEDLWRIKGETPLPVLSDGALGVIYGTQGEGDPDARTDVFSAARRSMQKRRRCSNPRTAFISPATGW